MEVDEEETVSPITMRQNICEQCREEIEKNIPTGSYKLCKICLDAYNADFIVRYMHCLYLTENQFATEHLKEMSVSLTEIVQIIGDLENYNALLLIGQGDVKEIKENVDSYIKNINKYSQIMCKQKEEQLPARKGRYVLRSSYCSFCGKEFGYFAIFRRCQHYICFFCFTSNDCPCCTAPPSTDSFASLKYTCSNLLVKANKVRKALEEHIEEFNEVNKAIELGIDTAISAKSELDKAAQLTEKEVQLEKISLAKIKSLECEFVYEQNFKDSPCKRKKMFKAYNIYRLDKFQTKKDFLEQIYMWHQEGQNFYLVTKVGKENKYGDITMKDGTILLHAMYQMEHTIKLENNNFLQLKEIKSCQDQLNISVFFTIRCSETDRKTIIINLLDSRYSTQIMKLCTGECGPCYRNSTCEYNIGLKNINVQSQRFLRIEKKIQKNRERRECIDYMYHGSSPTYNFNEYNCGEVYVKGSIDGSIDFFFCFDNVGASSIGKAICENESWFSFLTYGDKCSFAIEDCGLVLRCV